MNVDIIHTPELNAPNHHSIVGDYIDEVIAECMRRVRPRSQDFYAVELRRDLERYGKSIIDVHAGNGTHYRVFLAGYTEALTWPHH